MPDADAVAFALRIPYHSAFGHRGASHSLAFAVLVPLLLLPVLRGLRRPAPWTATLLAVVMATHPLLDALTDGGLGVALLWPFSEARFFAPLTPLPVAPIGRGLLSARGFRVMAVELLWLLPLVAYAVWPGSARTSQPSTA